jgi:hypothetical protein
VVAFHVPSCRPKQRSSQACMSLALPCIVHMSPQSSLSARSSPASISFLGVVYSRNKFGSIRSQYLRHTHTKKARKRDSQQIYNVNNHITIPFPNPSNLTPTLPAINHMNCLPIIISRVVTLTFLVLVASCNRFKAATNGDFGAVLKEVVS